MSIVSMLNVVCYGLHTLLTVDFLEIIIISLSRKLIIIGQKNS